MDNKNNQNQSKTSGASKEINMRQELMRTALRHIVFDGWSATALSRAANDIGLAKNEANILFPDPFRDLLTYYHQQGTDFIIAEIPKLRETHPRLHLCLIESMMALYHHYKDERPAIARASQKLALPQYQKFAFQLNAKRADAIWYSFGDNATDWNYYTKRGLLMMAMASTHPIWLGDESDDLHITRDFFTRRIHEIMKIPKLTKSMHEKCHQRLAQQGEKIQNIIPNLQNLTGHNVRRNLRMRGI